MRKHDGPLYLSSKSRTYLHEVKFKEVKGFQMITYLNDLIRLQNSLSILIREGRVCSLQSFYDDMMEEEEVLKKKYSTFELKCGIYE